MARTELGSIRLYTLEGFFTMSVKSVEVKDGNARRKLLRKYDGDLDRRLQYREGSLIHIHYLLYKQADDDFDAATKAYRTAALELAES
ncbi:hypothetical protein MY11210_004732 [Beauveria gryllotalpidicola]